MDAHISESTKRSGTLFAVDLSEKFGVNSILELLGGGNDACRVCTMCTLQTLHRLSIYLLIYLPVCLSLNLSIYLSIFIIYQPICLYLSLSIYLSVSLSLHPFIYPSICLSICLSIYIHQGIVDRDSDPQEGTIAILPKKGQQQGQYNWYIGHCLVPIG